MTQQPDPFSELRGLMHEARELLSHANQDLAVQAVAQSNRNAAWHKVNQALFFTLPSLLDERDRLIAALKSVLPLAEIGFYLTDGSSYSGGDGYSQPYEFSISWEWQQSQPNESGWGALLDDTAKFLATFTEEGEPAPDLPVFTARQALSQEIG